MCAIEDMLSTLEDDISRRTGQAVKRQREALGLSLRTLASRSGISPSMISDIERGSKSPTVVTLARLAEALGVGAGSLVDGGPQAASRIRVLRQGEQPTGEQPAPWSAMAPRMPGSRVDFVSYRIPPATVLGPTPAHEAGTVEHLHVATGIVRVSVGGEVVDLAVGDSCSCRTDIEHSIENPNASTEALVYLVVERG